MNKIAIYFLLIVSFLSLTNCEMVAGVAELLHGEKPKDVAVLGVSLDKPNISLLEGKTETLKAVITPDNATNKAVYWKSSNDAVATVENGVVTGITAGSSDIIVTTIDGNMTAKCAVTVSATSVDVTGVSLDKPNISLLVGGMETLTATVAPTNATNKNVTWSSSHPNIATVLQSGLVTGVTAGSADITVTTEEGNKTAICSVIVSAVGVPVTGVSLNKTNISLAVGGTEILKATVAPSNATNKNVTWSSSHPGIARVDSGGGVIGITAGNTVITVTTIDSNKTADCLVTVNAADVPVTSVSLNKNSTSLIVGGKETLTATIAPSNATNQRVTWNTSAPEVVTVENGLITGITVGSATITVTTADSNRTAACGVTVSDIVHVTGIYLNKESASLSIGGTETLTVTFSPPNATNQNVTWSSDTPSVASISQSGVVSGVSEGTATITVTTIDGNKTATCVVTVRDDTVDVTGVTLNKTTLVFYVGGTEALAATVAPSNATNKIVSWSSSASSVATVSSSGVVTAVGAGNATITVTTVDGSKTATCSVTVTAITSATLASYLASLPINTVNNPYNIMMKVSSTGEFSTIFTVLEGAPTKYVKLDLTGSTITSIPDNAFHSGRIGCKTLIGIIIPNSVTSIGSQAFQSSGLTSINIPSSVTSIKDLAFSSCNDLISVTFQGTISSSGFSNPSRGSTFPGDLRAKFYAINSSIGTSGTYTRPSGGSTWTRQ
jgi:uncharacterized protein YjdB